MAEELQGLLDRIHQEGVKKADEERARLVQAAKEEAARIIKEATDQADSLRKKGDDDASASEKRAKAAIQQAARDIILATKDELLKRLHNVMKAAAAESLTSDCMQKVILEIAKGGNVSQAMELLVAKKDFESFEKMSIASLVNDLKARPQISISSDIGAGLKIGFKGSDMYLDFSDETLSELICAFIGPKLAEYLKPEAN
ncbi:MAG: hypothetical protein A2X49_11375 [Lentisphaerae bacterium GWF2_52_8]|nr:MAG: hypothetical protein A2X49_11375 [Lentisphaerae bacterium GWF2_52_8]